MQPAKIPFNETARISALKKLDILDTPVDEPFQRITRIAKALFNTSIAAFSLVDSERQWFKSIQGLDVCETSREVSFCAHAINQNDIFIVNDATKDERFRDNPLVTGPPYIRFYAGCPIKEPGGKKIGSLCVIDSNPRAFSNTDEMLLRDLAKLIENELSKSKVGYQTKVLVNKLEVAKKESRIDTLTRLYNREGITQLLEQCIKMADENKKYFGVALIDIDNFKQVNDQYGHIIGDMVLKEVSSRLLRGYRDQDVVGRWGGEEFLVILNELDVNSIFGVAERARQTVKKTPYCVEQEKIPLTITTGLALYSPDSGITIEQLIDQADKALYEGKHSGKDRVIIGAYTVAENAEP